VQQRQYCLFAKRKQINLKKWKQYKNKTENNCQANSLTMLYLVYKCTFKNGDTVTNADTDDDDSDNDSTGNLTNEKRNSIYRSGNNIEV